MKTKFILSFFFHFYIHLYHIRKDLQGIEMVIIRVLMAPLLILQTFADSRTAFDLNLFSISTNVGNNKASFSLKNISNSFNTDSLINQIFGSNAGKSSGFASVDLHGPSLMINTGLRELAVAVTTRARVMANVTDMDGRLTKKDK